MPYRCHAVSGEKTGFPTAAASFGGDNERLAFSDFPISRRQRRSSTAQTPATDEGQYALAAAVRDAPPRNACACARMHIYGYGVAAAFASRAADAARRFAAAKRQSLA